MRNAEGMTYSPMTSYVIGLTGHRSKLKCDRYVLSSRFTSEIREVECLLQSLPLSIMYSSRMWTPLSRWWA